jgi:hypothetical protein
LFSVRLPNKTQNPSRQKYVNETKKSKPQSLLLTSKLSFIKSVPPKQMVNQATNTYAVALSALASNGLR